MLINRITPKYRELVFFLLKALILFIIWVIIDHFNLLNSSGINSFIISNLILSSKMIMEFVGFDIFSLHEDIGISGAANVHIGDPCNALDLMYLFASLILLLPGKWINKLWFIPAGLIVIHSLNIIRVIALIWLIKYYPKWMEFNHAYTFTLVIYLMIFLMWVLWNRKFATYSFK